MDFKFEEEKIKKILLSENYVGAEDMKKAEEFAKSRRASVVDYLLKEELITKDLLGQAVADYFKIPYADLNSVSLPPEQVFKIGENAAREHRAVLFKEEKTAVVVATDNPEKENLAAAMEEIFKPKKVKFAYSLPEDIDAVLTGYRKALETRFVKIIKEQKRVAAGIIDEIFEDALVFRASDIHFEPQEKEVIIRFRIDGILQEVGRIPKDYYESILNRVKVQAHMRIDEHFSAQDGAIRYAKDEKAADIRVSVAPTLDGERIVMRLLSEYVRGFSLAELGLSERDQQILLESVKKPYGMILVTGPTGSGKTTTMYALLKTLNSPQVNIITIEDPVEYKISGVNHIQVNPQTNLTFAKGLRSIIRQDPDIILVGEIRDEETAEIAVNAALIGHLLFSTFHANNAAAAVSRLLDMGIEPFLLSSTLNLIFSQRLVRKICPNCRYSYSENLENLEKEIPGAKRYFGQKTITLYKGKGCELCKGIGYRGRTAIFEFIKITPEIQELILRNPTPSQIWELAEKQGSRPLFEDGVEKAKTGITTIEELLRVSEPPALGK